MADTTLPGTIAGLLRKGSPCIEMGGTPSVIVNVGDEVAAIAQEDGGITVVYDDVDLSELFLDLADPTGRAHAAWWVAEHHCRIAPRLLVAAAMTYATDGHEDLRRWSLRMVLADDRAPHAYDTAWDAACADLDPADPRLLPDGSRLVDALALQRVVLHVAGAQHG